jgi:hypothetical protein
LHIFIGSFENLLKIIDWNQLTNLQGVCKMKTSIKSFVSICALYSLTFGLAFAQSEPRPAEAIIGDGWCSVFDEDGISTIKGGDLAAIVASSVNGNINMTCSFELGVPTSNGRTVVLNYDSTNAVCRSPFGTTEDWHQVITSKGKFKLSCHFKD